MSLMSETEAARCRSERGAVELFIEPSPRDLGDFSVRRALPAHERRMVGPFIFFDHFGPAEFPPGQGIQVRPHPHIGIATITYLFEGEIIHRDSLGCLQPIRPGAINLMTAGRGIVHSERAGEDLHATARLHGIQSWIALPDGEEECEPAFAHHPASDIPLVRVGEARVRVIMGEAFGVRSPVRVFSPMMYLECELPAGGALEIPATQAERAAYVVTGSAGIAGHACPAGKMAVLASGAPVTLRAAEPVHVMIIGGSPVGERHIWWNFVSSSRERIERAKADWREGRFAPVPGDAEFIPLPD